MSEVEKAEKAGFNAHLMLWKGLKIFALAVGVQLVPVVLNALSDSALISTALTSAGAPTAVTATVTALLVATGKMAANWWNHRDKS